MTQAKIIYNLCRRRGQIKCSYTFDLHNVDVVSKSGTFLGCFFASTFTTNEDLDNSSRFTRRRVKKVWKLIEIN